MLVWFLYNVDFFHLCFLVGIYGGFLLGVRSVNGLAFYDWENTELIRRIEIQPKHVSFYMGLKDIYLSDVVIYIFFFTQLVFLQEAKLSIVK